MNCGSSRSLFCSRRWFQIFLYFHTCLRKIIQFDQHVLLKWVGSTANCSPLKVHLLLLKTFVHFQLFQEISLKSHSPTFQSSLTGSLTFFVFFLCVSSNFGISHRSLLGLVGSGVMGSEVESRRCGVVESWGSLCRRQVWG